MRADELKKALAILKTVVDGRSCMPVLSHVRLEAQKGRLFLTGTDLDTEVTLDMPCAQQFGPVCVPLAGLAKVATSGKKNTVEFSRTPGKLLVAIGGASASIPTLAAEEFPAPKKGPAANVTFRPDTLRDTLEFVLPAASEDETRFTLNGVCFDGSAIVATDGHRLNLSAEGGEAFPGRPILHKSGAQALKACLAWSGDRCQGGCDKEAFVFEGAGWRIVSRRIEGEFPDYSEILTHAKIQVAVDSAALRAALSSAKSVATDGIAVALHVNGAIDVSASDGDNGTFRESVACSRVSGEGEATVGLNLVYLSEALPKTGDVVFGLTDEITHVFVTYPAHPLRQALVMPRRL